MTERLDLQWDGCDAVAWDRLLAACDRSSLEQSWAYGEAVAKAKGRRTRRLVARWQGEPLAVCQLFELRRFLPATLVQIVRGPLWLAPQSAAQRRAVHRAIKRHYRLVRRELLVWMPELPDGPESEALMRDCGARRMVTGAATAWLDLSLPADALRARLHGKWRNALVAAERAGLELREGAQNGRLDWLVKSHDGFRRQARYLGPSGAFLRDCALADPAKALVLLAYQGEQPLAGVLLLGHGACATYAAGYTAPAGRAVKAHNLLLWQAVLRLKARGTAWLDLGGVSAAAPGVARFKLGLGGEFALSSGTYI